MSRKAADAVTDIIHKKPDALICIPSGDTPTGMYANLAEDHRKGKLNIDQTWFIGLDEWGGLNKSDNGSCGNYLHTYFLDPLQVKNDRYFLFDGRADDLQNECNRAEKFIDEKGGIELAILGLGMNGHLGINEPGVSVTARTHVVKLDELTKKVGQKYFDKETSLSSGITIGLAELMAAKTVFLLVSGKKPIYSIKLLTAKYRIWYRQVYCVITVIAFCILTGMPGDVKGVRYRGIRRKVYGLSPYTFCLPPFPITKAVFT